MRQFIGKVRDDTYGPRPALSVAPEPIRRAAAAVDRGRARDDGARRRADPDGLRPGPGRLGRRRRLRGTRRCGTSAPWRRSASPFERAQWREVRTLSGGEQKRLVLEALLRGPEEVLLLDEPDNYLDVPTKRWLEEELIASPKTVLFVSHDRELLDRVATRIATLEPTAAGSTLWVHPAAASPPTHQARADRNSRAGGAAPPVGRGARQAQGARRDVPAEGVVQLRHGPRAAGGGDPAAPSSSRPARRRCCRCEQSVRMRLAGGRTAKRAVICEGLELTGLMQPFDLEVWFGERVAVLGSNGSGKSHFLRLMARGGSDPDVEHRPVGRRRARRRWTTAASPGWAPGCGPGWFAQTHDHPELIGPDPAGDPAPRRRAPGRQAAGGGGPGAGPLRAGAGQRSRRSTSLSGGQQARFQILLLELSRGHAAAARRADRQPRPALGRGAGGRAGRLRGHRPGGDPRPVVRARLRPVPGLRRRTVWSTRRPSRSGTRAGSAARADGGSAARRSGFCKILQKLAVELWRTRAGPPSLQRAGRRGSCPSPSRTLVRDVAATSATAPPNGEWPRPDRLLRHRWSARGPIPSRPPGAPGPARRCRRHARADRHRSSRSSRGRADRDGGRLAAVRARLRRRLAARLRRHRPDAGGRHHDVQPRGSPSRRAATSSRSRSTTAGTRATARAAPRAGPTSRWPCRGRPGCGCRYDDTTHQVGIAPTDLPGRRRRRTRRSPAAACGRR